MALPLGLWLLPIEAQEQPPELGYLGVFYDALNPAL
jgi:hypothetical protein